MIPSLEAKILHDPNDLPTFVSLATEHALCGQTHRTLLYLNEVRHLLASDAGDQLNRVAELYLAAGASAWALSVARDAVGAAPKSVDARLALARALLAEGRLTEGDASLRLASRLGAPSPRIRESIAFGLDPEGRFAEARRALEDPERERRERTAQESLRGQLGAPIAGEPTSFTADLARIGIVETLDFLCEQRGTGWFEVRHLGQSSLFGLSSGAICAVRVDPEKREDTKAEQRGLSTRGEIVSVEVMQGGLRREAIETLGALIDLPNGTVKFLSDLGPQERTLHLPTRTILKLARVVASGRTNARSTSSKRP